MTQTDSYAEKKATTIYAVVMDGKLEKTEAISALAAAAKAATEALPDALRVCTTREEMQKVIADRDICQLAYTNCLVRSLTHTGPFFEQTAKDLEKAANEVTKNTQNLKDAVGAIGLLSDVVRLATSLTLAFA